MSGVSVLATLKVKEEEVENAVKFFNELAAGVRANEPGTLAYVWHQKRGEPSTFVVYEKYESEEALKTHGANLAQSGAKFASILAGRPEIVQMDEI